MIQLLCADVDGTLVGANGAVHPDVWRAAARARDAGIRLALCSGRPAFGITREYAERFAPEGWHIFQNGASVVHFPDGRTHSVRVTAEQSAFLRQRAKVTGFTLEFYGDTDYAVEDDDIYTRRHAELLGVPFRRREFDSFDQPVVRAQWMVRKTQHEAVLAESCDGLELWPSTSPLMPDTLFVGILPRGTNKGTGVQALADEYGIPPSDIMFVGDAWNDLPALQLVGYPVAMANAEPEAIAIARHVVGHVDDGGLAEALDLALRIREAA
ncbi:MAG: Cof-type HAD-IIB family hydrolase [Gemmatimonadaceae bacterium]|nr:Cof-type HAD-IIB family hydrolase [Gemmatimonadaceae bacterium]